MAYRRSVRIGFGALAALVVLAAVGLAALPLAVRPLAVWQLGKVVKRPVALDTARLNLLSGRLDARGLRITDHDGAPLATLDRLEARFRPLDLLRARVHVVEGALDGLALRIVRTGPREFNVSDLVRDRPPHEGGASILSAVIERFVVRSVAITIEDRTLTPVRTSRIELAADVSNASTVQNRAPGQATLRGTVAGAPIDLAVSDLRLDPLHLRAVFTARDLDAQLAAIALPPGNPFVPTRGRLTISATVEHDAGQGTAASLELASRDIELSRYNTAFLSAPAVRLNVDNVRARGDAIDIERVTVDGGTIVLADAQLGTAKRWQLDGVRAEASHITSARDKPGGTATAEARMAGAQVSLWAANVRLMPAELHATTIVRNVDLAVMRAYLPPALPAQPERGLVNATVRVDHGVQGTRLGVDATMSDIEVVRPGHVVTSPGLRLIATDVDVKGAAVTVGHATLNGARLTLEERNVKPVRTWPIQNLAIEARDLSTRHTDVQGVATLNAAVAGGTVSGWVTGLRLDPLVLHATASLRNLDLAILRFYLPAEAPVEFTRGSMNAAVQVNHSNAEGTRLTGDATLSGVDARGRWQFSTMALAAPAARVTVADMHQKNERFSIGRLEVIGRGTFTESRGVGARVEVANVSLSTEGLAWPATAPAKVSVSARFQDRGELEASGTARLTAAPPAIAGDLELDTQIRRVDIAPLAAFVPAAQGLGGQVRGKLALAISKGETLTARVRGDVSGSRLALNENKRTLLSLRRFSATGVDVDWPSRVTVAQLRLGQPYAWVERDPQGALPLLTRFAAAHEPASDTGSAPAASAPPATSEPPLQPAVSIGEVIVEAGSVSVLDQVVGPTARIDIPRIELFVRDVTWPKTGAARTLAEIEFPGGGVVKAEGTVTPEPAGVDLTVSAKDVDIAAFRAYLHFRARVRGRIDADVTVAGPLAAGGHLTVRGDAGVRAFSVSDGLRPIITTERIRVRGIDALWPERVVLDRVRVRKSWAVLERDRYGQFYLRTLFERPPTPAGTSAAGPAPAETAAPAAPTIALEVREAVFDDQSAMIVDQLVNPPARIEIAGAQMVLRELTWPQRSPMKVTLNAPAPGAGRLAAIGTVSLDPVKLDLRVALDNAAIEPAQAYLPIAGQVMGQATGDINMSLGLDPLSLQATGELRVQRFRLNDGDRAVVTVGRLDTSGIDVDWPRRLAVGKVLLRRPRLLVERDSQGEILLARLFELDGRHAPAGTTAAPRNDAPVPGSAPATPAAPAAELPPFEVGTLVLERASGRFVDHTTTPPFAEELDDLDVTVTGLSTAPGRRVRFTAAGSVGGGTLKAQGDTVQGDRDTLNVQVEIRNYIVPRANPYLDRFTAWRATNGVMDITAHYTLNGTRLESRNEIRVRDLDVAPVDQRDEVQERVGLPFGMLVSLLKDARNQISLTLPVSGDLGSREFNFQDAVWGAVRSLALRLVALPFSKIGSLFVSSDSRVEAVAIKPVTFPPGRADVTPEMSAHLNGVAKFLHESPSVKVTLRPIMTQTDVDALRQQANGAAPVPSPPKVAPTPAPAPPNAPPGAAPPTPGAGDPPVPGDVLRDLATRRLEAVRQAVGVDPARLPGRARRAPLIEATGTPRIELDLRPEPDEVSSSAER